MSDREEGAAVGGRKSWREGGQVGEGESRGEFGLRAGEWPQEASVG